jgi:hypothetical protein
MFKEKKLRDPQLSAHVKELLGESTIEDLTDGFQKTVPADNSEYYLYEYKLKNSIPSFAETQIRYNCPIAGFVDKTIHVPVEIIGLDVEYRQPDCFIVRQFEKIKMYHSGSICNELPNDSCLISSEKQEQIKIEELHNKNLNSLCSNLEAVKKKSSLDNKHVAEFVFQHHSDNLEVKMYYLSLYKSALLNNDSIKFDWLVGLLTKHFPKELGELLFNTHKE